MRTNYSDTFDSFEATVSLILLKGASRFVAVSDLRTNRASKLVAASATLGVAIYFGWKMGLLFASVLFLVL